MKLSNIFLNLRTYFVILLFRRTDFLPEPELIVSGTSHIIFTIVLTLGLQRRNE